MYGKLNCLIQDEYAHPKWQKKDGHTCPADVLCSVRSRATAVTHRNLLSLLFSPLKNWSSHSKGKPTGVGRGPYRDPYLVWSDSLASTERTQGLSDHVTCQDILGYVLKTSCVLLVHGLLYWCLDMSVHYSSNIKKKPVHLKNNNFFFHTKYILNTNPKLLNNICIYGIVPTITTYNKCF